MEGRGCCCGPQAFTSGVLGTLACLLVTGGVFLAFHRWDPLWLVVSAVGALLALVGSLLHCCAEQPRPVPQHKAAPPLPPLPEQLVPLSNARSVSQLSLNMLPGYFPPVVAAYGIEQHSAVVQNIVGGQQHLQQRGAKLLLLSLPDHTPQASLHNLVAAVYQLDGNVLTEIPPIPENNASPAASPAQQQQQPTSPPVFKHAEVQTTTAWSSSPSQPGTSLDLLDCSSPICDTLVPTDQVLVPLRQVPLDNVRVEPSRASVSTETQGLPISEGLPRTSSITNTKVPPENRRSSTRRSVRTDSRRPSNVQVPSTSAACQVTPDSTAGEQIPTRSEVPNNVPLRVDDGQVPGTSRDSQTALRSSDVSSNSNSITNETRPYSRDTTESVLNANDPKSASDQECSVPTPVRTSLSVEGSSPQSNPSCSRVDDAAISIEMPPSYSEIPPSPSNEVIYSVPTSSEVVQESPPSGVSRDNATPIHCHIDLQGLSDNVQTEVSTDSDPSNSSSSSSVLIDITNSEAIPSTSTSEQLLDESMLGAVGGGSSELSLSDMDEAELMERSEPPPSYDDVTHERDGSFAMAYGTI